MASKSNFQRTSEEYKMGQVSYLEFREAQLNLSKIKNEISETKYHVKYAELKILWVSSMLLAYKKYL